ncbi:MAG: PQQ-binding-like beta-propeller repeat protein [Pseudobdellovibrionaceae bacterium]|jgi:outer membrane protein assembly factor BamB|nr:PQQ-binding-like beta-propeller repeat protein [Pseudobdellovibrionaceae bacterium]
MTVRISIASHAPCKVSALALLSVLTLTSCSWFSDDDKKQPLPGDRISILELQTNLEPKDAELSGEGFVAPQAWTNEYWPQAGGYPNHSMQNPALNAGTLKKIWSVDIGSGSSDEIPLIAQPVLYNGVIYTLDTESNVSAFSAMTGKRLWERSVRPKKEGEDVISGGLAVSGNILFVTGGYGEALALDLKEGKKIWRASLSSPSRAAPTVMGDSVYILTVDNRLSSFNVADGKLRWEYEGLSESAGIVGAASPAANNDIIVAPLSSGELMALRVSNGSVAWSENLSSFVQRGGSSSLPDISALPVLDKELVFGVNYSSKILAIEQRTGRRVWQRDVGSAKTPWVAGNSIFMISSDYELIALGRDSGALAWVKPLDTYLSNDDKEETPHNPLLWNGPVLAGGRLFLCGPEGMVYIVDPSTGEKTAQFDSGVRVAVSPVIANETLYLLGEDGTLSAWK